MKHELKVQRIREGTVIDHITAGRALSVLKILGITGQEGYTVSVLLNVPSKKFGQKDIIKIESRELNPEEQSKIALIAPNSTINIIRNYEVVSKRKVKLPKIIKHIVKCTNPTCISNKSEPIEPFLLVKQETPIKLKCHYCGTIVDEASIVRQLTA